MLQPGWTLHTIWNVKYTFNNWKHLHEVNKAVKFIETGNGEPQWEAKSKDLTFLWGSKCYPSSRIEDKRNAEGKEEEDWKGGREGREGGMMGMQGSWWMNKGNYCLMHMTLKTRNVKKIL